MAIAPNNREADEVIAKGRSERSEIRIRVGVAMRPARLRQIRKASCFINPRRR